ncbi:glycosyltransferase family 25 protein [Mesorhizobium sp. 8]|uniref:glycosyltransferase family 25 protein n=1 Tax=Mesorhizobium sp. 8 TaxID=2584466 RepID=UPI0011204479|nr:glycosyltransferase family 25 protein [Mesorhizobium sp. 8]QDB99989.1 glycosyltransferase family 25 protein [Mesorhizobium sp. 8]
MVNPMPVFVINLDRSPDRLRAIRENAGSYGIELTRIPAVDGAKLPPDQPLPVDRKTFERIHGKRILPAEIGCYLSHLNALETIAKGDASHAVIVEDDVGFNAGFVPFLERLRTFEGWDAVKLVNHRTHGFVAHARIDDSVRIGRCAHGPCGSSAAYVVTKAGAARLLDTLSPMRLPYDVALERGWSGNGYAIFSTDRPLVALGPVEASTIAATSGVYKKATFPPHRRIGTLIFRISDYLRRIVFALQRKDLHRIQ